MTDRNEPRDGWATHAEEQRLHWLSLTPTQRLEWLEEMLDLALKTGALVSRSGGNAGSQAGA